MFNFKCMKGQKTGGRKAGTPNKANGRMRELLSSIVNDYFESEKMKDDIALLKPKDRVEIMEKLAAYVVPKLQSTTLEAGGASNKTIEDKLVELCCDEDE